MFIRYICHEIRNPLNAVQLGLEGLEEIMLKSGDTVTRLEILRDVKASLLASITTLNDMLTSDKIRSGLLILSKKDMNLMNFLLELIQMHQSQVLASFITPK